MKIVGTARCTHTYLPVLADAQVYQAPPCLTFTDYVMDLRRYTGIPALCNSWIRQQPWKLLQKRQQRESTGRLVRAPAKSMGRSLAMRAKKKADSLYIPDARSLQQHSVNPTASHQHLPTSSVEMTQCQSASVL